MKVDFLETQQSKTA